MLRRQVLAGDREEGFVKAVHARLHAGADVVGSRRRVVLQGEYVGAGHVPDVDVVAGLFARAVYRRGPVCGQVAAKYRHHPRLAVWVLAGPVDVGVAKCDVAKTVLGVIKVEVAFPGELRDAVGGDRVLRMVLGGRERLLLAVDRATRGGKDDLAHAVLHAVLQEAYGADYVHIRVEVRLEDRAPNVHLGGLMGERLGGKPFEGLVAPGSDVHLVKVGPIRDVLAPAAREVVHDGDLVTAGEELLRDVRPDKSPAPGDENPHLSMGT